MTRSAADRELLQDGVVRLERLGHVLLMTLNRPDARNAVNAEVTAALGDALERLTSDPELRVGVLTGTGSAFCAGQDLKAFAAGEPPLSPEHPEWGFGGFVSHFTPKPLIAAVNGFAFGGGFELALACDLIVASESASFALPEVTVGLFAAGGGAPRIVQQLPPKVGAHMIFTGRPLSARDAERWGLVNEVVAPESLEATALELAGAIAANAPLAVQASKKVLALEGESSTWRRETWTLVMDEFRAVFGSNDAAEGARAFVQKRAPQWSGT